VFSPLPHNVLDAGRARWFDEALPRRPARGERTHEQEILDRWPRTDPRQNIVTSHVTTEAARQSAAAPEFSLGLAGSVIKSRYRVNAVSSVSREVVVYSAEDILHGRSIALKVLRDEFARDAEFVAAVRNQASALAAAAHALRGVQRVHEYGATDTGQLFVALEWAEGATLREVLDAGGPLAVPTALRAAIRIGEALEALHHNRLLHGQLGPDSVLMVNDGERIRLVGVELAAAYRTPIGLRLRDEFALAYRAPEQIERGETTTATDVYALGMLLRRLLTAGKASQTGSALAATPPLLPPLQRIIATALEARPVHRYPDISVMVNDIWGAMAALTEPESRPRVVKARGNPRRRVRRRGPAFTLRMTAAVVTAGIVAAVVWVAGFDRIVSHFQSRVTPPAVTAVPVERDASSPAESPSAWGTREPTSSLPPRSVTDQSTERLAPEVGRPLSAPALVRSRRERDGNPPAELPAWATREPTSGRPESRALTDKSPLERPALGAGRPFPAPAVVRPQPVAPAAVGSRPRLAIESGAAPESVSPVERRVPTGQPAQAERTRPDAGDGSAAIDWLLKDQR
jgi:serine/threonine protein kinase